MGDCDVDGSVLLTKTDVGIWVSANIKLDVQTECVSCLDIYATTLDLGIEEEYFPLVNLLSGEQNQMGRFGEDVFSIEENNMLDLSDALKQYASLQSPISFRCTEFCKGLCIHCGTNINRHECGCDLEKRNSKWSALFELNSVAD